MGLGLDFVSYHKIVSFPLGDFLLMRFFCLCYLFIFILLDIFSFVIFSTSFSHRYLAFCFLLLFSSNFQTFTLKYYSFFLAFSILFLFLLYNLITFFLNLFCLLRFHKNIFYFFCSFSSL